MVFVHNTMKSAPAAANALPAAPRISPVAA